MCFVRNTCTVVIRGHDPHKATIAYFHLATGVCRVEVTASGAQPAEVEVTASHAYIAEVHVNCTDIPLATVDRCIMHDTFCADLIFMGVGPVQFGTGPLVNTLTQSYLQASFPKFN
jgi:hypothetical protein